MGSRNKASEGLGMAPDLGEHPVLSSTRGTPLLLSRWTGPTEAQVHDGTTVVATMAFEGGRKHGASPYAVRVLDCVGPNDTRVASESWHPTREVAHAAMVDAGASFWMARYVTGPQPQHA